MTPIRTLLPLLALTVPALGTAQLTMSGPATAWPVLGDDGRDYVAYELTLISYLTAPIILREVAVIAGTQPDAALVTWRDSALRRVIQRPGFRDTAARSLRMAPGASATVFLWAELPVTSNREVSLVPSATFVREGGDSTTVFGEATVVRRADPLAASPPLAGGDWLAGNAPSATSIHRQALLPVEGHTWLAQRFAIDFVRIGANGLTWQGDSTKNSNYFAYEAPVQSMTDGVVTAVKDGIPENVPQSHAMAVPITLETVGGNYVIVQQAEGGYGFYAHLRPGSLTVKRGDRVRRGQQLGLIGNSGNSSEPHLHVHVADRGAVLEAEGRPYVFTTFELVGECPGLGKACRPSGAPRRIVKRLPLENALVRFGR